MISAKREPEIISFTQVPKQNQPWRSFKSVRRIKREIKRSIRSGEINHVEVEEDILQTNRLKRHLKNLLGRPLCRKINFA